MARRELRQECDYKREARAIREFRRLIAGSQDFFIPDVIDELSTDKVLTTEFIVGKPVDQCANEPQVVRDYIAGKFIELCLKEVDLFSSISMLIHRSSSGALCRRTQTGLISIWAFIPHRESLALSFLISEPPGPIQKSL